MRKILIYGDKTMDLLRHEHKLMMVNSVLEEQRIARRSSELRGEGAQKAAGVPLVNDLSSKRQQRLYMQQFCATAHSFTPEGSDGALQRATQQMLLWRQQEEN